MLGLLDLTGLALLVVLAVAEPFADVVALFDGDKGDVVGLSEGSDQLLVLGIVAVVSQHAKNGLLAVKCFADLVETLNKT